MKEAFHSLATESRDGFISGSSLMFGALLYTFFAFILVDAYHSERLAIYCSLKQDLFLDTCYLAHAS